ncbi:MAG: dolichol kinase [Ignavibacteriae bacterium]|nr:dolichol kinase [Ignavibacteriota bacterium]MCB9217589.1 dolichol kinase [Ignavibacteria bacterium]
MAVVKGQARRETEVRQRPNQISMRNEVKRKLIHLSSLGIPLLYWLLPKLTFLWLLLPATGIAIVIEVLRRFFPNFDVWFRQVFGSLLRPHESGSRPEINGATFVLISACLCVLLFPKIIGITSFTVLIVSDTASALYGRRFGKRKFLRKSVEGSSAFFVTAMMVVVFFAFLTGATWEFLLIGVVASIVGMVVEALSEGGSSIDDNLTIPTTFGGVLWLGLVLIDRSDLLKLL